MAIINESAARIAKELSSFSDYVEGSATASYNAQCAEAAAILEQVKPKCATADQRERAEWLYNRYCTVLAEAINRKTRLEPVARPYSSAALQIFLFARKRNR